MEKAPNLKSCSKVSEITRSIQARTKIIVACGIVLTAVAGCVSANNIPEENSSIKAKWEKLEKTNPGQYAYFQDGMMEYVFLRAHMKYTSCSTKAHNRCIREEIGEGGDFTMNPTGFSQFIMSSYSIDQEESKKITQIENEMQELEEALDFCEPLLEEVN